MIPIVEPALRTAVQNFVHDPVGHLRLYTGQAADVPEPYLTAQIARTVIADVLHFRFQTQALLDQVQYAAVFADEAPGGEPVPLLLQVPDLYEPLESYEAFVEALIRANVELLRLTHERAFSIFVDRLAEFLAVQVHAPARRPAPTTVHSNRNGDTVLYAKGYFLSTGTAFGTSTPAIAQIAPGRYSFGIFDGGTHRFENVLWTCPTTVTLHLP